MPAYCTVPYCKSTKGKVRGISFHEIPSDPGRRQDWLKAISRQGKEKGSPFQPDGWTVVCSEHFKPDDYRDDLKIRKLKSHACPSIFKNYPSYMVPPPSKKRRTIKKILTTLPDRPFIRKGVNSEIQFSETTQNLEENLEEVDTSILCPTLPFDVGTQTPIGIDLAKKIDELKRQANNFRKVVRRRNNALVRLQDKVDSLQATVKKLKNDPFKKAMDKIVKEADEQDNPSAKFLMDQILNFAKKSPRYSEFVLRHSIAWRAKSTKGYEHVRRHKILRIPSRTTLKRYMGNSPTEVGITALVKQRLLVEIQHLKPSEKFGSIILDEMKINEKLIYDKDQDRYFGNVDMGQSVTNFTPDKRLADHLLCFILEGLSTRYTIPAAYFFTRCVTAKQLHRMTCDVLECVENCGFEVVRVVTDNLSTNTAMFKVFGKGKLKVMVPHPLDETRSLFLSFDPNHVMKNLWVQFLNREMVHNGQVISSAFVKKLVDLQKSMLFKPVRFLRKIHIEPTNFEKMRVFPAVQIFSPPVTATIETLRDNPLCHQHASFFRNASETVKLMKTYYKWFRVHNSSNRTYFISSRDRDIMHFFSLDDERLEWLENGFLEFLSKIKEETEKSGKHFLTDQTYEAVQHTSRATALTIKYLLRRGFAFVYTRELSSDPVENFYSALRQMCGGNDVVDVRAAVFAIEGVLKAGIVKAAKGMAIPEIEFTRDNERQTLPDSVLQILSRFKDLSVETFPSITIKNFTLTFVGGYLVHVVQEHIECHDCKVLLACEQIPGSLHALIRNQDRGGLSYPTTIFVSALGLLQEFCEKAVKHMDLNTSGISKCLETYILSKMTESTIFKCPSSASEEKHNFGLCSLIVTKFVRPLLRNYAELKNASVKRTKIDNKPLSRKVFRV